MRNFLIMMTGIFAGFIGSWIYMMVQYDKMEDQTAGAALGLVWFFFYCPIGLIAGLILSSLCIA